MPVILFSFDIGIGIIHDTFIIRILEQILKPHSNETENNVCIKSISDFHYRM